VITWLPRFFRRERSPADIREEVDSLWRRIFGRDVLTYGGTAFVGPLSVMHRPGASADGFGKRWHTDARRIFVVGDIWIFDHGETPTPFQILENPFFSDTTDGMFATTVAPSDPSRPATSGTAARRGGQSE
jgi:hypothetical protein